ncbi:YdiY family protein [Mariprofundus ferrooxydans]|uniref:DUF481 domain-containing protein n=1 Tax=Mariprofundus ferrooxydans PV-1 TaxID=314345 RepID=Q0EXI5_9PROT|nr:DUF481 domain-containing protein [Mariprofundus ferrooxydans]EAU53931.1 hypothetical protein SPV1_13072 [Mariprofundus ferrooxydans PV-1]KON47118.1 hypothetical protein AL013_09940 [Mariprofundus ferrooxydans]
MPFLIFILLFLAPSQALAIINAEDLDLSIHEDGTAGKVGFSLNGNSGNSAKINGEGSGRLLWRHGSNTEMLVGSYAYGKSRGVRDTNEAFVHLRHRYALNDSWDVEAFAQAQQNEFARLKLRTLLGGGLRWSSQAEGWQLHVGLGSFFERESLRGSNAPATRLWRGNAYLGLHFAINDHVRLQNTVYYQPAWRYPADFRLLDDAAVSVTLSAGLDLRLSLEMAHDSRPPAGVRPTDISYKTGLAYAF